MKILKSDLLSEFKELAHGFVYEGVPESDHEICKRFNLKQFKKLKQIHSDRVVVVDSGKDLNLQYEADSLITNLRGVGIGIYTADCVPIILFDTKNKIVAAVHAGWRGTHSKIVSKTISSLLNNFNTAPQNITAVIGPCIGKCCYEVRGDVAQKFIKRFSCHKLLLSKITEEGYLLDLKEANLNQMKEVGLENIEVVDTCTKCDDSFPSYRRDGESAGRMLSFAGLV